MESLKQLNANENTLKARTMIIKENKVVSQPNKRLRT